MAEEPVEGRSPPKYLLMGIGSILTSSVVAGFILGYMTDLLLSSQPIFMMLFGVIGFAGGLVKTYQLLMQTNW